MAGFKDRLRTLRKQCNFSQQELADKMGVTKQTISQYERGVREPDFDSLAALCDFFNVSTDYILGKVNITMRFLTEDDLEVLNRPSLSLMDDESELLENYRKLNEEGKTAARTMVKGLVGTGAYSKTEDVSSISSTG